VSRRARGLRTRTAILRRAVDLASAEGLEGLTVGRLADDLGMSKSGLFAHFGSKEELQLATVETARQIFIDQITRPALSAPRGMPRLWYWCVPWSRLRRKGTLPRILTRPTWRSRSSPSPSAATGPVSCSTIPSRTRVRGRSCSTDYRASRLLDVHPFLLQQSPPGVNPSKPSSIRRRRTADGLASESRALIPTDSC